MKNPGTSKVIVNSISALSSKDDLRALKDDILKIETVVADKYANTIKWLFLFWIGTIGTFIGIIKFL